MITPTPNLLRVLVSASAALFILEFVAMLGYLMLTSSAEPETLGLQNNDLGPPELFACFAIVTFIPAYLAALIGLAFIRNWARWLYFGTLVTFHALALPLSLFDFSTAWGFPSALAQVEAVIGGLILGFVFCSPLAREFRPIDVAVTE